MATESEEHPKRVTLKDKATFTKWHEQMRFIAMEKGMLADTSGYDLFTEDGADELSQNHMVMAFDEFERDTLNARACARAVSTRGHGEVALRHEWACRGRAGRRRARTRAPGQARLCLGRP